MTEAMPFLQKAILLSYAPRPLAGGLLYAGVYCPSPAEDSGVVPSRSLFRHPDGTSVLRQFPYRTEAGLEGGGGETLG